MIVIGVVGGPGEAGGAGADADGDIGEGGGGDTAVWFDDDGGGDEVGVVSIVGVVGEGDSATVVEGWGVGEGAVAGEVEGAGADCCLQDSGEGIAFDGVGVVGEDAGGGGGEGVVSGHGVGFAEGEGGVVNGRYRYRHYRWH